MKHFDIGKLFGLALLGLQAYNAQDQPGAGPSIFMQPAVTAQLMAGVLTVLAGKATPLTPIPDSANDAPVAQAAVAGQ